MARVTRPVHWEEVDRAERVRVPVPPRRPRKADERGEFGIEDPEHSGGRIEAERPGRGGVTPENPLHLLADPLRREMPGLFHRSRQRPPRPLLDPEAEPARETKRPQDPQVVFPEPCDRIPDRPENAALEIGPPLEWVAEPPVERVPRNGVDREVAPREILVERIREGDDRMAAARLDIPPEGCDLVEPSSPVEDADGPVGHAHGDRPAKERLHLRRRGLRGKVPIQGHPTAERVADRPPDGPGLEPRFLQGPGDPPNRGRDSEGHPHGAGATAGRSVRRCSPSHSTGGTGSGSFPPQILPGLVAVRSVQASSAPRDRNAARAARM